MGCVQQAVLEFDEEIQAPWRPRFVPAVDDADVEAVRPVRPHPSRRSPSRVGVCRPPEAPARPVQPVRSTPARRGAAAARPVPPIRYPRPQARRSSPVRGRVVRLRPTRRARRLAVMLALALGVALGSWLGPLLDGGPAGDLRLAGGSSVVVQADDTLWSIATSMGGEGDVRSLVDEIQRLNGLDGADLVPGQVLRLP
jgi:nucleoid-associated protein YgaU